MIFGSSVASITRSLSKISKRLQEHSEQMQAQRDHHYAEVSRHNTLAEEAAQEHQKALDVAAKIAALIS